jgi:ankyrin repeat protein
MRPGLAALLAGLALAGCGGSDEPSRERGDLDRRMIEAAFANDVEEARRLIAQGADVNAKDVTKQSAYLIATSEVGDDPRLLELTLANGARVDDKDSYDGTGLIRAAERGHPRIVRRLLEAGIDRDHVNRLGWTALHEAVVLGDGGPDHVATVRALVRGGVDVKVPDGDGVTALQHARERGFRVIVRALDWVHGH